METHNEANQVKRRRFAVALSFPDQQRQFVRTVATHLASRLGDERVFFDEWYEVELAGKNGDLKLQQIYLEQSELVVPFFSKHYKKKWCKLEWDAIRAMLVNRGEDAVCAVRLDNTEIEGWLPTDFHIPLKNRSAEDIAGLILHKIENPSMPFHNQPPPSRLWQIVLRLAIVVSIAILAFLYFLNPLPQQDEAVTIAPGTNKKPNLKNDLKSPGQGSSITNESNYIDEKKLINGLKINLYYNVKESDPDNVTQLIELLKEAGAEVSSYPKENVQISSSYVYYFSDKSKKPANAVKAFIDLFVSSKVEYKYNPGQLRTTNEYVVVHLNIPPKKKKGIPKGESQ